MKSLKRLKSREYHKNRKSVKWRDLDKKYKEVESIKHLTDDPLQSEDINIPVFDESSIPKVKPGQVQKILEKAKENKSVPPGDLPPRLIKVFAAELSIPTFPPRQDEEPVRQHSGVMFELRTVH